ncbi:MAG: glutathione S-transferase family protein [Rubrobacteraceae bacterium]
MKLYEFAWGIYPRRVLVYLAEKGITDLDRIPVDLMRGENRQPAFLELNPAGTVPVLDVRPEGIIRQSTSIIEYLEEIHPSPDMIGDTPEARAATRDLIYMINECYIYLTRSVSHSSPAFASSVDQKAAAATAYYAQYRQMIGQIEQVISDDEFLRGDQPTIADCMMFASAQFAHRIYGEPLPRDHPKLSRFYSRFEQRSSAAVSAYPE